MTSAVTLFALPLTTTATRPPLGTSEALALAIESGTGGSEEAMVGPTLARGRAHTASGPPDERPTGSGMAAPQKIRPFVALSCPAHHDSGRGSPQGRPRRDT